MNKIHVDNPELFPRRSTLHSAGYDFIADKEYIVPAHSTCLIDCGVSVELDPNKVFMCYVRSSYGFKYGVTLANGTGVIDSDFYPNKMKCKLKNDSDTDLIIHKGDKYMQGMIIDYYTFDNEIPPETTRDSGIGSTGA